MLDKIVKNKQPTIEEYTNPEHPMIKKIFIIIENITFDNIILKDYNVKLKLLLQDHYRAFYNNRCKIYEGDIINVFHIILIDGIIARSLNIFEGLLREFEEKNLFSFHCLLRAHIETLSLIYYINKNPDYIGKAVKGMKDDETFPIVNIITMIEHTSKKYDKLKENYDILSEYTHPNPISLRTNLNINLPKNVGLSSHMVDIPDEQALIDIELLIRWTDSIFDELELLNNKIFEIKQKSYQSFQSI